jgi:hypothetical protein
MLRLVAPCCALLRLVVFVAIAIATTFLLRFLHTATFLGDRPDDLI